ncbi:MAG: hypothetical protein JNN30_06935 [Rhodanobacteraceae bacterium]|nr:hypothetical protein [Rhodanobacteraceae bacterium]
MKKMLLLLIAVLAIGALLTSRLFKSSGPESGKVLDEAMLAGVKADQLRGSEEDYFRDMDYGITKDPEKLRATLDPYVPGISAEDAVKAAVRGRNNWVVWTAGNDRLWDQLSRNTFGNLDLIKTLSSHKALKNRRSNRWEYLGLVNEPCFKEATGPRKDRYGLWLDERVSGPDCPPDPYEDEKKYPGVPYGARGKDGLPLGSYYGYASGIVGLRLFPNPDFDKKAQERWDPERYYNDASYYNDKNLVKPYRVGMSCGFCHVGPNPVNPPADFNNPKWANLNSNPGAQYFWIDRIFMFDLDQTNFIHQLFATSRPGALDTSLVSSDQINNPRTMNAVYQLGARLAIAQKWGKEKLTGTELGNKQFNDFSPPLPANGPLNAFYDKPNVYTPRVLKDGSDSTGSLAALNRVYVNIGLFSEEWLLHFIPVIGGPDITPFPIAAAGKNSSYWQANTAQTPDLALFFLAATQPDYLKNAPNGTAHLSQDTAVLDEGKKVFAEHCARCHSSKLPDKAFTDFFPDRGCVDGNYLKCWADYWKWSKTDEFKAEMRKIVEAPDFLENNFLSTELRIPSTLMETNACSPLATNAIAGNIWNDFSSTSYKNLPSVGTITVHHPYTLKPSPYAMPAGGRGYTRPASLVSLWSTAPFLQNNSLGKFNETGTVEGRLQSFDSSIKQLLWPQNREGNITFQTASGKMAPGIIDRTTKTSFLKVPGGFLPKFLERHAGLLHFIWPNVFAEGGIELGPIPAGTPVNLLSNINLEQKEKVLALIPKIIGDLKKLPRNASDPDASKAFANLVEPLLEVSKCPDFIVNRGHYFGTDYLPESEGETPLTDAEKNSLIEFLKTL